MKLSSGRGFRSPAFSLGWNIGRLLVIAVLIFLACPPFGFAQQLVSELHGTQSQATKLAQARDLLRRAYQNAPLSDDGGNTTAWLRTDIAESFAELGDHKEALKVAKTVKGEPKYDEHGNTLRRIVLAVDRIKGFDAASRLGKKISSAGINRDQIFLELAEAHIKQGDLVGALAAADSMSAATVLRNKAYHEIGIAFADQGDLTNALRSIRFVETLDLRASILKHVAMAQAKMGKIDAALHTASEIPILEEKVYALCAIAVAQGKSGNRNGSDDTFRIALNEIKPFENNQGPYAIRAVTIAKARSGDLEGARAIAEKIVATHEKDGALAHAIIAYAESGHPEEAWEAIKSLSNPYSIGEARAKIVRLMAQTGQLDRAEAMAKEIVDHIYAPIAQYYLVAMQAKLGRFEEAERIVGQLLEPYNQAAARHALAMSYAKAGNFERALDVVSLINHGDYWSGNILRDIAAIQVEREGLANTLKWIAEKKSTNMSYALIGAAEGIAKRPSLSRRIQGSFPRPRDCGIGDCPFLEILLSS